jgi:bifunctional enzyme CysN/CysC
MPWYSGPTVLRYLESVETSSAQEGAAARFLVQSVVRPDSETRSYAGFVASGAFARGERIVVPRSGQGAAISRIYTFDGDIERAVKGQAVTFDLDAEIDLSRGDVLAPANAQPNVADQMAAQVVWLDDKPLLPGRTYTMLSGTQSVSATVTALKHRIDVETGQHVVGPTLQANDIGFCNLSTTMPISFDAYGENRVTGSFVLVDRESAATVGAGMMAFPLYRASNIRRQSFEIDKAARAHMKAQRPCIVWFTGLSGAGKSTIMNLVEQELARRGTHTYALDGDNLRFGLNRDLGFTDADRVENVRRAGEVAKLMVDAGLVVLCAFISPFRNERQAIREKVGESEFIEVYVDTPLNVCIARDAKGLYAKARAGQVPHVTGITSPYEPPLQPEIHLQTVNASPEQSAGQVVQALARAGIIHR